MINLFAYLADSVAIALSTTVCIVFLELWLTWVLSISVLILSLQRPKINLSLQSSLLYSL